MNVPLGGHADIIAGVLATSQDNLFKELKTIQRYRGAVPSAFDCYLLERSLQTLEVCTTIYCYFLLVLLSRFAFLQIEVISDTQKSNE